MSARRRFVATVAFLVLLLAAGCGYAGSTNPSPALKESDLVGTWTLRYGRSDQDWLCLRSDGLGKQIYKEWFGLTYHRETSWEPWWLEQLPSGIVRLHLQGARYYLHGTREAEKDGLMPDPRIYLRDTPSITAKPLPSPEPLPWPYNDVFADELVEAPRQLVLDVRQLPSGEIVLFHLLLSSDEGYNPFYLGDVFRRIDPERKSRVPVGCR